MTQNRKRGRNMQEDEVEFMPLSKRINNLHINGNLIMETQSSHSEWGPGPPCYPNSGPVYRAPETPPESTSSNDNSYQPSMNEVDNPHYYYKNKLLFELHQEKLQRNGPNNF